MKQIKQMHSILVLSLLGLVACMPADLNEKSDDAEKMDIKSVEVIAHNFVSVEANGRTSVEVGNEGAIFSWAENDTIGIFPNNGYQIAFPMTSGVGSQSAIFDGGGWALNVESEYAAYYPFCYNHTSQEYIEVTYLGQSQKGNGHTEQLSAFDYMTAMAVSQNENKITFDFHHVGALLQWKLKVPEAAALTSFSIQTDEALFVAKGMLNFKSGSLVVDSTSYVSELPMGLSEVSTGAANQEVIIYMMVPPMDLTGQTYRLKVTNETGAYATADVEGKRFEAGKVYALSAELSSFVSTIASGDTKVGKVMASEGGEITLDTEWGCCQYIISEEARGWIQLLSGPSSSQKGYTFQVNKNEGNENRRGLIVIRNLVTDEAVEYAVLQGGEGSYAITEPNGRMPLGILTSNSRAVSEEHGLSALVDCNLDTYYEADTSSELHISWEGPYALPIQSVEYGCDAGESGLNMWTFHVASDGTDWDGLGWSVGQSIRNENKLGVKTVICRSRFYRLIVNTNHGGATIRVAEFGVTVDNDREKQLETLDDVLFFGEDFTAHPNTPMGNFCLNLPATTSADLQWLSNPNVEPDALNGLENYPLTACEVNLYPYGNPSPADVNNRGRYDTNLSAALADMAYLYPSFIKSIISSQGNGIYAVKMFDPIGNQITVCVTSKFYYDGREIKGISGKDGKANWATIMEKAIIKWNQIYKVASGFGNGEFRSEYVIPMFTGDGASFKISANVLNSEQLAQAVKIALKNGLAVVRNFSMKQLEVNGLEIEGWVWYSVMLSNQPNALFAMRNPKGSNSGGTETDDGVLHIANNDLVPRTFELYFIYPGVASKFFGKIGPYVAPNY